MVGYTGCSDFPLVNPIQSALAGDNDAFVTKINESGTALIYSTFLGGSSGDRATSIALDGLGNTYVAGVTESADFPIVNATQATYGGNGDAFVTMIDASGTALSYSTYLGGSREESRGIDAEAFIAVDASGNAYVAGRTTSADFPTTDRGCGASYFSQQCVFRLALAAGIEIPIDVTDAERLRFIQDMLEAGHEGALKIWQSMGIYLGYGIAHYADFYDIKHLLILGRCTSAAVGACCWKARRKYLKQSSPNCCRRLSCICQMRRSAAWVSLSRQRACRLCDKVVDQKE